MAILTNLAGIPLFTTIKEALTWAASKGLSGYHTHVYRGRRGYMGGANHQQAIGNTLVNTRGRSTSNNTPSNNTPSSSGGGY
tara:strand:+ start:1409 stop:1654 length:246 start_codon:yes stop_codon:yes gene_type:complete